MHCGVRLHGQNACYVIFWNIAPKHWIYMGIATHFIFIYDFIIIGNMLLNVFLQYNIENMVDIKNFKNFIMLTSNIEYGDIMIGFFSILQFFPGKFR